ncbi:MAG: FecR domain-containing protein [Sedimentisphaerales bacterium]|nr:FecR domain-containing protein [Sedimentisphaerales bacterium]
MKTDETLHSELAYLILLAVEGKINDEGFARLNDLLKTDPRARGFYATILDVHLGLEDVEVQAHFGRTGQAGSYNPAVLEALAEYEKIAPAEPRDTVCQSEIIKIEKVKRERIIPKLNKVSLVTAIGSLAAMIVLLVSVHLLPPKTTEPIAYLGQAVHAKWDSERGRIAVGDNLPPGPMHLLEGAAEIVMHNGATVILEAPIQFDLETSSRIFLRQGRMVVSIKNSSDDRFVVRTPFSTVVDFGTEFGVQVNSETTQARVFEGQVELRSGSDPLKYSGALKLDSNQGGIVNTQGAIVMADIAQETFLRQKDFEILEQAAGSQPFYRWKAYHFQLHRDPALAAHYTFEKRPGAENRLMNAAPQTGAVLDGALGTYGEQPEWVRGRWEQKAALRFDRSRDQRIVVAANEKLAISGPITIAAWVYLHDTDQPGHILSCRDKNQIHYQMSWFGAEHPDIARRNRIQMLRYYQEPTVRGYSREIRPVPHQWHFLAVSHDNHTVRFYLNGDLICEVQDEVRMESLAADLVIGGVPLSGYTQWRFDGLIDEIVILNRVMNTSELQRMYWAGKP